MHKTLLMAGLLGMIMTTATGAHADDIKISKRLLIKEDALPGAIMRAYATQSSKDQFTIPEGSLHLKRKALDYINVADGIRELSAAFALEIQDPMAGSLPNMSTPPLSALADCDVIYIAASLNPVKLRNCTIEPAQNEARPIDFAIPDLILDKSEVLIDPTSEVSAPHLPPGARPLEYRYPQE